MKKKLASLMILALLNLWVPYASAEMSEELDPMVSPDAQVTMTSEGTTNSVAEDTVSNTVSTDDVAKEEKKVEETKKGKSKKSSKKKSSEKKKKKSSSKGSKKHKKSSN